LRNELWDIFYRIATELIDIAIRKETEVTLSEALTVLLQTWNNAYYQFRSFDTEQFDKIDQLVHFTAEIADSIAAITASINRLSTSLGILTYPVLS